MSTATVIGVVGAAVAAVGLFALYEYKHPASPPLPPYIPPQQPIQTASPNSDALLYAEAIKGAVTLGTTLLTQLLSG